MSNRIPLFQKLGYALNSLHLFRVTAGLRWLAYHVTRTNSNPYADPDNIGYNASIEHDRLGCIAFERMDGSLQFRW